MKKYLVVVAGWHYFQDGFYGSIKEIVEKNENIDVFISSHKEKMQIDNFVWNTIATIPRCEIRCFENIGFDWGMYSQAIDFLRNRLDEYEYIFFMHDDIEIKDQGFPFIFIDFLEKNNLVAAGNGVSPTLFPFPETHPEIFQWAKISEWKVQIRSKEWTTVRGSFFVTRKDVFDKIARIPFKIGANIRFGNWSLIIFWGMVADVFGQHSVKFISEKYLNSPYINEYERGQKIENNGVRPIEMTKHGLRVNIGCGKDYRVGYLNVDCLAESVADIVMDINKLEFEIGSVSEVLMYHLIEHLNKFDAEDYLKKIFLWLADGGKIVIECPDVEKVARLVLRYKRNMRELETGPCGFRGLYGEAFHDMPLEDYHKWGYSEFTLSRKLVNIGFQKIVIEKPLSHGRRKYRDLRVIGIKDIKRKNPIVERRYFFENHYPKAILKVILKKLLKYSVIRKNYIWLNERLHINKIDL